MKTKQEQIDKMASIIFETINRENIDRFIEDKNGNLVSVETVGIEGIAEAIINSGYGDISEYKAEIKRLRLENALFEKDVLRMRDEINEYKSEIEQLEEKLPRTLLDALNAETKELILSMYSKKMQQAVDEQYLEDGHAAADSVLCELLTLLGYDKVVKIYNTRWQK